MGDGTLRFAVLEHRWDGVHWDFLLEHGEALRTWAIDAPIVAGRDLPARALPTIGGSTWTTRGRSRAAGGRSAACDGGEYEAAGLGRRTGSGSAPGGSARRRGGAAADRAGAAETPLGWVFRFGKLD